jgi:hypothetical protein
MRTALVSLTVVLCSLFAHEQARPAMGPVRVDVPPSARGRILTGRASWFAAPDGTAAAGPALRAFLGHWRGQRVMVCGRSCVTVRLTDWMRRDRLVDLNPDAFRVACGPLSRGVCEVTVQRAIVPPATDAES